MPRILGQAPPQDHGPAVGRSTAPTSTFGRVPHALACAHGHGRTRAPVAEAGSWGPLQVGEDRLLVRVRPVRRTALLLDRARISLGDLAVRPPARPRLSRSPRADLLGGDAPRGSLAPARRDADARRAVRHPDWGRADRAQGLGNRRY